MYSFLRNFKIHFFLAILFSITIIFFQTRHETPNFRIGDSYAYMSVAKNLTDTGVFTDGRFKKNAAIQGTEEQGMFFAPLYPMLIAGIMGVDRNFYDTVSCHMTSQTPEICSNDMGSFHLVQIGLAIFSAFLVWLSGWIISGKYSVAWLALVLSLFAEAYAYYTAQIMTENLVFPLFTMSCLSAAAAWKQKRRWLWFVSGLFLGLLALTRPSFVYLFYAALPIIFILGIYQKELSLRKKISWSILLLLGYSLTAGPWIIRNGLSTGEYAISKGYASYILVQRVSYNDMTWKEWGVSFLYGLPDFGDSLTKDIFDSKDYERFDYQNRKGFYAIGNDSLRKETLEKAGGVENHLSYLLENEVFNNLHKHIMVTLSLAWRGMWVSKYWGLITIPIFFVIFIWAIRQKCWEFIIFSLPPWFMLGFHAFTSVNVVRYNLILIPCLALATAFLLSIGASFIKKYISEWQEISET